MTVFIMVLFTLFVGGLGFGVDAFLIGATLDFPLPLATIAALAVGAGTSWWGLQNGAQSILASSTAYPVPPDPTYRQLQNVAEEMAIASGLPLPQVYIIPDPDPNAFAAGKDPHHACIAVTEGLLSTLDRNELQGVIAHEMSHIRNYDIRLMTVVAALVGATLLLAEFGLRTMRVGGARSRGSSSRRDGGNPVLFVLWIVALILAPLIVRVLSMAVSRQREYLADASAAELTRHPLALASALEKIDHAAEPTRRIKKGSAPLCIADPLGRPVNSREGPLADLMATHPPMEKRIAALRGMGYAS